MIKEIKEYILNLSVIDDIYIKEFSNNSFFGKDSKGNFIFARINNTNNPKFSMCTKTVTVYQNYSFEFFTEQEKIKDKFDVLILNANCTSTLETFITLCLNFYSNGEEKDILSLTEDLIEIYKMVGTGDYISQQGLWGELFTIMHIYEKYGINLAKYWHEDPFNKYDFSLTSNLKLEVKTTIKEYREHEFSHEQIFTDNNVIVASLMMQRDDADTSIVDLVNRIEPLFVDCYNNYKELKMELAKYSLDNLLKFNYSYAEKNIKFFRNVSIPKFNVPEPDGVHGTKYLAQLEFAPSISEAELKIILEK